MLFRHIKILLFLIVCSASVQAQTQSVLRSGNWYKLAVEKNGVYKISYDLLRKTGIDPAKIDPRKIRIYGNRSGMLPQANHMARTGDLMESAIYVSGETDGKFDKQDYILFYAEGPDKISYDINRNIFHCEKHLYSNKNFYFLTVGEDNGKRIGISEDMGSGYPVIREFNDLIYYENDQYNELESGREWFGERLSVNRELSLSFGVDGIVDHTPVKVVSGVMGRDPSGALIRLLLNDVQVAEQVISPIPDSHYGLKGHHRKDTIHLFSTDINAPTRTSQQVKYQFKPGSSTGRGFFDFILIDFIRKLAVYREHTIFRSISSLTNTVTEFEIANVPSHALIWDVTDPVDIKNQAFRMSGNTASFSTSTSALKTFVVFTKPVGEPELVGKIENQNLHGLSTPEMIIITHGNFYNEALRLANHRQQFSNITAHVVRVDEVYNEFSGGRQDVTAIRDFVKFLYDKNPATLKALLLFGKCSYDYKDRYRNNTNFVPTYESRNSLHPLLTFSSDDYFTFLEDHEGNWDEDPAVHHTSDIAVGRLPVRSVEEARNVVDKIIQYDTDKRLLGAWRKQIVFLADDGNSEDNFTSLHQDQANQLANFIEQSNPQFDTRKIFMGTYIKITKPNGEEVPDMADDILRTFERGALIINFTGHGSEKVLADERVFTDQTLPKLKNKQYPFLVTATCEFGRHDNPEASTAELLVTLKNAGAIGLVTTTRPVQASSNFGLNYAFYEALFQRESGVYPTIGEVFRRTKNNSPSGISNRNFSLLADPMMHLALPTGNIQLTEVSTESGSDTLKALSTVLVKGHILDTEGELMDDFNGLVEATLFDKQTELKTIGKNDPPYQFKQWQNALFRGKATVTDGRFEFQFILPTNLAYTVSKGKFSSYAFDPNKGTDATGIDLECPVGGKEPMAIPDNTPPVIQLFMADTTFINGGITTPNTDLVARLHDTSGINISGNDADHSIIAILDNDKTFTLNDYYIADKDDFTSGTIRFPLKNIPPGRHTLVLSASDVYNNRSQGQVDFIVTDGEFLVIESFANFPNPFRQSTTLYFTHNRSGDDLQAYIFIYSPGGELIQSGEVSVTESDYRVDLLDFQTSADGQKKLSSGLYLARLVVRSLTNGSKNERITKLIILN